MVFNQKRVITAMAGFLIVFLFMGRLVIDSANLHYYEHIQGLSINLAKGYVNSITQSINTEEVINELLEDKLLTVGEITTLFDSLDTPEELARIKDTLRVDQINIYNEKGVLLLSSATDWTEWQAYEGHPIQNFLNSPALTMVEDIREHAITGIRYKFGYYKLPNQKVIQVGILAERIMAMLVDINIQTHLDNMVKDTSVAYANYFDPSNTVSFTTQPEMLGRKLELPNVIEGNEGIGYLLDNQSSIYELYVPIEVNGVQIGILSLGHDIQEQKQANNDLIGLGMFALVLIFSLIGYVIYSYYDKHNQLSKMAFYDKLTNLPNAEHLEFTFDHQLAQKQKQGYLIIVNIDEFKYINMTYGYDAGNQVIAELGRRLKSLEDDTSQLFRWSADRFIFLIKNHREAQAIESLAQHMVDLMQVHFDLAGVKKLLHVHIGVVSFDHKASKFEDLVQKAILTIEKEDYHNQSGYKMYNHMLESLIKREELMRIELSEIIQGIDAHRLSLVYQPMFDLRTNTVYGFEALARLESKHFGHVSPLEFITLAEKNHMIFELGQLILEKACLFRQTLVDEACRDTVIAVNISGIQLAHVGFIESLMDIVEKTKLKPNFLEIEVTESSFIHDYQVTNEILTELRGRHIRVAIDDFGTGFSSLNRLSELQVDTLKIDRSFIARISNQATEKVIVKEIIQMAHKLSLVVITEGIEQELEFNYLRENACDIIQGFFYSQPLTETELKRFLKNLPK